MAIVFAVPLEPVGRCAAGDASSAKEGLEMEIDKFGFNGIQTFELERMDSLEP
ncbi:hypothetical protein [Limnobacter parvus]|uniref:Uncharacterized protein n=1 Tax=Limnobacter parvus TaxID=2939690 RepID=A0ABT1XEN3_9BURK|nr:hypothetical protein [Limnobacter parvus]MCR2745344.1 hypothetical protein [Limnobacter parvus]